MSTTPGLLGAQILAAYVPSRAARYLTRLDLLGIDDELANLSIVLKEEA